MQPGPQDFEFDLPGLSELPPADLNVFGDDPEPATPAPPPDAAALAKQIEELNRKLETTEKRLEDTQRWGQQNNGAKDLLDAIQASRAQEAEQARRAAEAERAFALPTLSDEDREALVADPAVLNDYIVQVAGTMANRVYHSVMPRIQQAEAFAQVVGPMIDLQSEVVASRVAKEAGLSDEEAAPLMGQARALLYAASKEDPLIYARSCMNPEMVKWSLRMAQENQPAGTKATPRAPSLGGGDPGASRGGGRNNGPAPVSNLLAAQIGRSLGVTFTKDDLAEVQNKVNNRRR